MTWTMERIDRLRVLWADGLSCRKIGEQIGKTRNAVIGKVHRLQLPARATTVRAPVHKPVRKSPRKPTVPKSAGVTLKPLKPVLEAPKGLGVAIYDLSPNGCKYPVSSEGAAHLFCNTDRGEHDSYCEYHHALCHQKNNPDAANKPKRFRIPTSLLRAVA